MARLADILLITHVERIYRSVIAYKKNHMLIIMRTQTDAFDKHTELARKGKQHIYYFQ